MVIGVGLAIAIIAMDIWGFKVVFGAWATWTHDWTEYKKDSENLNYCACKMYFSNEKSLSKEEVQALSHSRSQ